MFLFQNVSITFRFKTEVLLFFAVTTFVDDALYQRAGPFSVRFLINPPSRASY